MKLRTLPLAAALILSPAPAMAQDLSSILGPGPDNPITMFKEIFKAEPLSAAEAARLPAAQQVADSLMPPGAYGNMIEESFGPMATKIIGMVEQDGAARVAKLTKLNEEDIADLDEAQLDAIITLLDPGADERNRKMVDFVFSEISGATLKVEPLYRDGLARAYARHFDAGQLAELNAFFATPTGRLYASRSLAMNVDPQVMAKIPDMLPVLVGHVAEATTRFILALDTIPQARAVDDLGTRERARLLGMLGMSEEEYASRKVEAIEFEWNEEGDKEFDFDFGDEFEGGLEETNVEGGLEEVN